MKNKYSKWLLIAVLSVVCALVSATMLCISVIDETNSKIENEKIVKDAVVVTARHSNVEKTTPISVDFEKLKKKNKDINAWLYCENTPINYPIVQSTDNNYYLRRLIDGTWAVAGTLFFDYRNSLDVSDWYTVIYGHNMRNDTMFGTLHEFSDSDYLNEHSNMYLFTPNSTYKIELIAGYVTKTDSAIYKLDNSKETRNVIFNEATLNSSVNDFNLQDNDKLLVLSTCSNEFINARFVLVGIIRKDI